MPDGHPCPANRLAGHISTDMAGNEIWRSPVSGKRRRGPDRREEGQGGTCLTVIRVRQIAVIDILPAGAAAPAVSVRKSPPVPTGGKDRPHLPPRRGLAALGPPARTARIGHGTM